MNTESSFFFVCVLFFQKSNGDEDPAPAELFSTSLPKIESFGVYILYIRSVSSRVTISRST
jgi:hypothetical protein